MPINDKSVSALSLKGSSSRDAKSKITEQSFVFLASDDLRGSPQAIAWSGEMVEFISVDTLNSLQGFEITSAKPTKVMSGIYPRTIAGVILSDSAAAQNTGLAPRLTQLLPFPDRLVPVLVARDGELANIASWMIRRAMVFANGFSEDVARAHLELGGLQRICRDQIETLNEAQALMPTAEPQTPKLGLYVPLALSAAFPSDTPGSSTLIQDSKREFRAVHSLDLHFTGVNHRSLSPLIITLRTTHSARDIGVWSVVERDLTEGWNRFDAPRTQGPLDEPVTIAVKWSEGGAPSARIGLGEIVADERLASRGLSGANAHRPLAIRIHEGIPGIRMPSNGFARTAVGGSAQTEDGRFNLDHLLSLAEPWRSGSEARSDLVRYKDAHQGVLVHPDGRQPVVAVIRNLTVQNAISLCVEVKLDHAEAVDTEFGVLVAPTGSLVAPSPAAKSPLNTLSKFFRRTAEKAGIELATEFNSANVSWIRLGALEEGSVAYPFDEAVSGSFDVFLMTRNFENTSAYAWAHFRRLYVLQRGDRA